MKSKDKIKDAARIKSASGRSENKKVSHLASILGHVPDGVCSIDTEGNIISWNDGAERILGYSAKDILGRPVHAIIPEEMAREELEHCINELNKAGSFTGYQTVRIAKDGRRVPVEISALALREGRRITGYASIMRDVTERLSFEKALLKAEARYRDIFENAGEAIFVLDSELRYVDVNRQGLDLLGYKREELLGRQPFDFIPEGQKARSAAEFDKLKRRGSYETFKGRVLKKDGQWIDVEVSSTAMFEDGKFVGSRDIVRDITGRKRMEEALGASQKLLEAVFDAAPS